MKQEPNPANYISAAIALLFMVLLMISPQSRADEDASFVAGVHLGSQHDPDPGKLANNLNPGLYLRLNNGLTVGAYKNSLHKDTGYIGWTSPEFLRLSVTVGVASGYNPHGFIPLAVPTLRLFTFYTGSDGIALTADPDKPGATSLRFAWIPRIEEKGTNVYHLMAERRF